MGNKYIIELPENTHWIQWILESTEDHHPYMDFRHVEDLTPYTEPDLDQVRKEAYDKGWKEAEDQYDDGYSDGYDAGLDDAWEAARKIASDNAGRNYSIFGQHFTAEILNTHSASECIEKIRQYEQEKEEQIQIGDEVIIRNKTAVVTEITDRYVRIMYSNGSCYALFSKGVVKTGRHFPEIAAVLEKMRGKQDG